jgi:hypothetical protein
MRELAPRVCYILLSEGNWFIAQDLALIQKNTHKKVHEYVLCILLSGKNWFISHAPASMQKNAKKVHYFMHQKTSSIGRLPISVRSLGSVLVSHPFTNVLTIKIGQMIASLLHQCRIWALASILINFLTGSQLVKSFIFLCIRKPINEPSHWN